MIWSLIQQIGAQAATMIVLLALAAWLPPSDFGLVGMAGAWLAVLSAFGETGFGAALIQRENIRDDHLDSTFGLNVVVGAALTVVGVALSWPAAAYFKEANLQPVMAWLSAGFLVRSFGLTQVAIAQRELRFRALAIRDLTASIVGGVVGISLAMAGYGVWSLVVMTLTNALLQTVLLWGLASWRPRRLGINRAAVADLWPFGSRMLGFNLFKALAQNTDRLVIGPTLGAQALGLYTLGFRATVYPVSVFGGAVGAYLFPRVARLQTDRRAAGAIYEKVLVAIINLVLPGLVAVAVLAPVVVSILGPRWHDAIVPIRVLTIVALAQALMAPVGQIMKGMDRPGWLVWWSIGLTVVTSGALWIGARWGLTGATLAYAAAYVAVLPVIFLLGRRLTGVGMVRIAGIAWRPVFASACLGGALAVLLHLTVRWTPWPVLALALALGAGLLAGLAFANPDFKDLIARELLKLRRTANQAGSMAPPISRG